MPLELKQQRILPAKIGRTLYRYIIRPVTREEWLAYFDSVTYEQHAEGEAIVTSAENTGSRIELLGKVLLDAEGYDRDNTEPGENLTTLKNWRDLLPISHRAAFANLLFACGQDLTSDTQPILGEERVVLRSQWTADDARKGLVEYSGLLHVFNVPSIEQQRRYSRDSSRSRIVGSRTKGKTQFLGAQRTLVQLYDELIVRTEGYTADGTPLDSNRDLIVSTMDTFHKAQAMGAVFAPAEPDAEEDTE